MKDFDHLLAVWQGQPKQVQLSVDDMLKQIKKGIGKIKFKLLLGLTGVAVAVIALIGVGLFAHIHSTLTYIGLVIWIVSIISYMVLQTGDYKTIANLDATIDPALYLNKLQRYKKRRAYTYGKFFYYYAIAVSIGVMFYSNEVLYKTSASFKSGFYAGWVGYMFFVLLYLKDKLVAKENRRIADLIEKLERLQQQFE